MRRIRKGPEGKDKIEGFADLSSSEQNKVSTLILGDGDYESSDSDSSSDDQPIITKLTFPYFSCK